MPTRPYHVRDVPGLACTAADPAAYAGAGTAPTVEDYAATYAPDVLARIAAAVGCPLPASPDDIAAAVERHAANARAREILYRRMRDALRRAERRLDAVARALATDPTPDPED